MKKVAILQSNYIPWKGYFDIMNSVSEFIFLDSVQYSKRDWRNRNLIKDGDKLRWLTVPVKSKGLFYQKIEDVEVLDNKWADKHMKTLLRCYESAAYFKDFEQDLYFAYTLAKEERKLCTINRIFIDFICRKLGIKTSFVDSGNYTPEGKGSELILELCRKSGADIYVTGPKARNYLKESDFIEEGITIQWFDYSSYPEYTQQGKGFQHGVSILDLMMNTGPEVCSYLLSF